MADVTDATFATAVIERSNQVPVVVDLWAPWCGPCKTLTPILERVIGETAGMVELAKVNVDENPQVSQAFRVQSIPAVYALRNGQVVDGFMGAQPEAEVVSFVQRLLNAEADTPDVDDAADDDATISEPGTPEADAEPEVEPLSAAEVSAIESELEQLLTMVKADDAARERYLELLESLGEHPETNTYRRRLATALF